MGFYSKDQLDQAASSTAVLKRDVRASTVCGCFCCLYTYAPNKITGWIGGNPHGLSWAICPMCGVDAVIFDRGIGAIDPVLLEELNKRSFDGYVYKPGRPKGG